MAQTTINGLFVERAWRPGLRHSQNIIFKKKRKVLVDGRAGYKSGFKRLPVITNGSPSLLESTNHRQGNAGEQEAPEPHHVFVPHRRLVQAVESFTKKKNKEKFW